MKIAVLIILIGLMVATPVVAKLDNGTRSGESKQKVQTIRDERKKKIVEINKRRTDAMVRQLDKMSEILAKVKTRGGDTAAAEAVVAEARVAVAAQAAKTYTGETMQALTTDLRKLHEEKIVPARKAVSDAISLVNKIRKLQKSAEGL